MDSAGSGSAKTKLQGRLYLVYVGLHYNVQTWWRWSGEWSTSRGDPPQSAQGDDQRNGPSIDPFQPTQGDPWAAFGTSSQVAGTLGTQVAASNDDNPFRRSEKWMPARPVADHSKWRNQVDEVHGFISYMHEPATWVGFGSDEFGREILFAVRQPDEILQSNLTKSQCTRSFIVYCQAHLSTHCREQSLETDDLKVLICIASLFKTNGSDLNHAGWILFFSLADDTGTFTKLLSGRYTEYAK